MAVKSSSHTVVAYLRSLAARQSDADDDRELLRRFAETRDGEAFAVLMRRHGPMVLNLARRLSGDEQLAEDVFQAAFVLLARKVHTIHRPESLPCWLHGVARRLALEGQRARRRRTEHESQLQPASPLSPLDELSAQELLAVLDEELHQLPENYRAPLILCCLEGLSQEEAAKRLGCSAGAVKGRLERGRNQLRLRLEKRGLTLPAVLGGTLLLAGSTSPVPAALMQSTLQAATTGGSITPAVAALIEEAMRSMFFHKLKAIGAAAMLLAVTGAGAAMMALHPQAAKEKGPPAAASADKPMSVDERVDLYGDPLPDGAVTRLGTIQRRAVGAQLAVTADGKSIVGVRAGRYVRVWDAGTGKLREKRELPSEFRGQSSLSPDGLWLAVNTNRDDTLAIWDVPSGKLVRSLTVKGVHQFHPVVFSSDSKRIAAVCAIGNERSVRVWDVSSGRELWQKHFATNYECGNLTLAPDGKRLLVSFDGMSCWDLASGRRLWENKKFGPDSMVITPDDKIVSTALRMPVLDLAAGRPVAGNRLPPLDDGHTSRLTLSPDGHTLLISTDNGVIVWDLLKERKIRTLREAGEITLFLPDGQSIVTNNGSLQRWDLATGKPSWPDAFAQGHVGEVLGVAFSADGRQLISASADGSLRLWDATTGRQGRLWQAHPPWRPTSRRPASWDGVKLMNATPEGRWILSAGGGEEIKLWDTTRPDEARSLRLPPAAKDQYHRTILRLRVSPDGARAIALFTYTTFVAGQPEPKLTYNLARWNAETGELLSCLVVEVKEVRSSMIAPDGRTLLVDGRFVDAASGREVGRLQNPVFTHGVRPPPETPYVFSADGALALSSFLEFDRETRKSHGGARLWETATGKTIAEAAVSPFGQVAFHPNHRFLVTNDTQGIRVCDASSGKVMASRKMPEKVWSSDSWYRYASCFALTRDGRRLATGMSDGTILLWDISPPRSKPQWLEAKELEALWTDLADADAAKAWRAVWRMAEAPQDALAFLRPRIKPAPTAPPAVTRKLLADLDSDAYEVREAAAKRLKELGLQAEPALRAALKAKPSLEQRRRIEGMLAALPALPPPTPEELRQLRALIVLERIATPAARRLLEEAAKGPQSARLTRQARAALTCLP
jgi:RNA polymerase sigma factor (sigma-70 family)